MKKVLILHLLFPVVAYGCPVTPGDGAPQRVTDSLMAYYTGRINLDREEARRVVDKALADRTANAYTKSVGLFLSGYLHRRSGDNLEAIIEYHESLRFLDMADTADLYLQVGLRKNIGAVLYDYGGYEQAIQYYEDALPYAEAYREKEVYDLYYNMGNAYRKLLSPEAVTCYFKALDIARQADDSRKIAQVHNQLGLLFTDIHSPDTAEYHFYQMLNIESHLRGTSIKYIGHAYHNLAQLRMVAGEYDEAIHFHRKALTHYRRGKDMFVTLLDMGEAQYLLGDLASAEKTWTQAAILYDSLNLSRPEYHAIYHHLANLYFEKSNMELYASYQKQYVSELKNHIDRAREIEEVMRQQLMTNVLREYEQRLVGDQQVQNLQWIGAVAGLALLALLTYALMVRVKQRRLNRVLDTIEAEITSIMNR